MPYNGVGVFSRIYSWVTDAANNINVDATRTDTDTDDIADGLSNCITKDGQQILIADIPWAGYKITDLGNGSSPQDATTYSQVFTSPAFTGTPTAPTAAVGTNTTQIATMAAIINQAFATALPAQPGGSITYKLRSLAGTASWAVDSQAVGSIVYIDNNFGGF